MAIGAVLTATAIPLFFLLLVRTLDLYGTGSPRALTFSLLWGAIAVPLTFIIYRLLPPTAGDTTTIIIAPIVEEVIKALALIYLVRRPSFTYFVDGAIYGFAAGIGFAVAENYLYIWQNVDAGLGIALGRVITTNLMHASASAIVGVALGLARFQRFTGRLFHLLSGITLAIILHAIFNQLVNTSNDRQIYLYGATIGISGLAFTALAIRRGLAVEKAWIAESLGQSNRYTTAEISATGQLHQADTLLKPLATLFGQQKADQIEDLLLLQAQLGILKKAREQARHDRRHHEALTETITRKQSEMETVRHNIGAYTMLSLRMLFPEAGSTLWHALQRDLTRRAARESDQQPPTSLFSLIEQRSAANDPPSDPGSG